MESKKISYKYYIYCFIAIFSTDTFIVYANMDKGVKRIFQLFVLIMLVLLIRKSHRHIPKKMFFVWLILVLTVVLSMVMNNDYSGENIIKIFLLTVGLFFSITIDLDIFVETFVKWIYIIALFSLIIYPFTSFIISHASLFPVITNIGNSKVVCLGLSNVYIENSGGIVRNYGPFWEPGVFSIYLCLALMFSLNKSSIKNFKNIVLIVTICSTISTAGILILITIIFGYVYLQNNNVSDNKFSMKFFTIIIFLGFLFILFGNDAFMYALTSKLDKNNYSYMSTAARVSSIVGNFRIWKSHPIFGVASRELSVEYLRFAREMSLWDNSNTNALLMQFSMYGVAYGIVATWGLLGFSRKIHPYRMGQLVVVLVLVMMLTTEPLITSLIFNILIFYSLKKVE